MCFELVADFELVLGVRVVVAVETSLLAHKKQPQETALFERAVVACMLLRILEIVAFGLNW